MMRRHHTGNKDVSLLSRCETICISENISLQRYIFDDKYRKQCKIKLKTIQRSGVVDSISNLLRNYNCDSKRLVNLLLRWEDAKKIYLKYINNVIMKQIERNSHTHTHSITPIPTFIRYNNNFIDTNLHHITSMQLFTNMYN